MRTATVGRGAKFEVVQARHSVLRKRLITCGIWSSLVYAAMNVLVPLFNPSYDPASQSVSELSAIGAPTRGLWLALAVLYTVLYMAFGWGVWLSAEGRRSLRIAGGVLLLSSVVGMLWPPMHQREVLAAGGRTVTDTLHIVWTILWGVFTMAAMGFGAASLSKRFQFYTGATIALLLFCGFMSGLHAANMEANLPTPWMGVWQRTNIGASLLWIVVFALMLWREGDVPRDSKTAHLRSPAGEAINGYARAGFEGVREAFAENFSKRHELGGACCIYHHGEKVVDLWGGVRNLATGEPWEEDTMVVVFSATKGMAAMALALANSRGLLDYEERVCTYWPEFAQSGKNTITVRQLLAHQAGLFAFHEPVDRALIADLDRLAMVLAREKPEWEPGSRQAYHAMSLGFYEGELLRRIDPQHRSLGQFFQDEIATPLDLDFYIRLPETIPNSQLAVLDKGNPLSAIAKLPLPILFAALNPRSAIFRALMVNPGSYVSLDDERVYARNLEVPSGGGVGTARAIARAYSAFANDGRELGLRSETLRALVAPAVPSGHGFYDEALKGEVEFSLGFMKTCPNWRFGHEGAFGSPGAGGSLGYADPKTGIAYAYVTNRLGAVDGDPRDLALRRAMPELSCAGA